ncbi:MAG: type II CRISPR RNA-guided endonuclease Cas9 [Bacteroidales bacterium]|nr:type II CRISPR RNA-guided endonuclease Cas9 [Bacteroidales bacterium]
MRKKILGIDLGANSIGWALIEKNELDRKIIAMGTRVIPLFTDEKDEFEKGNSISKNEKRRLKRGQRRGYDRYQLRRKALTQILIENKMFDPGLFKLDKLTLWGLRAKACSEKVELPELGRILYHLNQKRGYKSISKSENKKDTEYVAEVKNRYQLLKEPNLTIGQKFYNELLENPFYRTKEQVYPREAYIEEYNKIMQCQQKYYPDIITDEFIARLRDNVIYYQRKLKSQKELVSICEFEGRWVKHKGKEIFVGPRVIPRSSPLFQVEKIWETINNLKIRNKNGDELFITPEQKLLIFKHLDENDKLSVTELFKILNLKKEDGWFGNKQINNGIQGNTTKAKIRKIIKEFKGCENLLQFNLIINTLSEKSYLYDRKTGEILEENDKNIVDASFEKEPFYQLWHTIYSIKDEDECARALIKRFNLDEKLAKELAKLDFITPGFGNKSARAIRKILPYLMEGYVYSDACEYAGYNHSSSLTTNEILQKQLKDKLELLPKNSLRQPVVEKILNQLVNLVNAIIDEKQGWVTREERLNNQFEIRIELARELKQSKEERKTTYKNQRQRERENTEIAAELEKLGLRATRNNIIKWRLFHEIDDENKKINAVCVYCGKPFGITDALNGDLVDVDHIIPRTLFFDDSQNNKTLVHRSCNANKSNLTAFDFMKSKGEQIFNQYKERINALYNNKLISKTKYERFLTPGDKIPDDFINRQLRETQYISRKSREILSQICYHVWSTSGPVTERLRRLWGWDEILMQLQLPKYREVGLTEIIEVENPDGSVTKKEVIKNWTKRNDQRHHAIDALTIACTEQGFIQRINTLAAESTRNEIFNEVKDLKLNDRLNLLDKYLIAQKPFNTDYVKEYVAQILVSYKVGKKVATKTKRIVKVNGHKKVAQDNILVPRGPLSEESVYGKIRVIEKDKPLKYLFENSQLIVNEQIKEKIIAILSENNNDVKKALKSCKEKPVYLDNENKKILEKAPCYAEKYVKKYPLSAIKANDVGDIVDNKIRALVAERFKTVTKESDAFKEPLYYDENKKIPIRSVRRFTGLTAVEPILRNENGEAIGFVKPGNNHHIALYKDADGKIVEHTCTFWHAVERKKYGLPVIITDTSQLWTQILNSSIEYPESFVEKLPPDNLTFLLSLQQNEMFILGMTNEEFDKALRDKDYKSISHYLYRVQKIASGNYMFRHHLETEIDDSSEAKNSKRFINTQSFGAFQSLNPIKVRINNIGRVTVISDRL